MAKVLISVEGATEERFVKGLLYSHLSQKNIFIVPIIVPTKKVASGKDHKGGHVPFSKMIKQVKELLGDTSVGAVTTMYDLYGLPGDFPGLEEVRGKNAYQKVSALEAEFSLGIDDKRFIPYIQLHEFEGLLFSAPEMIAAVLEPSGTDEHARLAAELQSIRSTFNTPEEIDDDPQKHPSKRIFDLAGRYEKPQDGVLIAGKIGVEKIRGQCPHFNEWLTKLEKLSPEK